MKTLYIDGPTDGGEGLYTMLTEDGISLANHWCSHRNYALHDLARPDRLAHWTTVYGGVNVLFIGEDEMSCERLMEKNRVFYWGC